MSQHSSAQRTNAEHNNAANASAQFQPRPFGPVAEPTTQADPEELQKKEEDHHTHGYNLTKQFAGGSDQSLFAPPSIQQKSEATEGPAPLSSPLLVGLPGVQAKLTVGAVGDKYEQEADAVAARVIDHIHSPKLQQKESVQREGEEEEELQMKPLLMGNIQREEMGEEEEEMQMKPILQRSIGHEGGEVSSDLESQINGAKGSGQSLAPELQTQMGDAMGADFSGVRIHTDSQSNQFNESIQATAFTTGNDVFFKQGEYQPSSRSGQELIAHELTHVVQQNGSAVRRTIRRNPQQTTKGVGGTADSMSADLDLLYAEAEVAQKELYGLVTGIAGRTKGTPKLPDTLKGRARAEEKTAADYGGDASKLVDIARGSIIYESYFDVLKGLNECRVSLTLVREKNRFATPTAAGYRDVLLNVQLSNDHIAELQLHLQKILDVKSGVGHDLYEEMRTIQAQADEAKRELTSEEKAKVDQLIAESKEHYDAAFAEASQ